MERKGFWQASLAAVTAAAAAAAAAEAAAAAAIELLLSTSERPTCLFVPYTISIQVAFLCSTPPFVGSILTRPFRSQFELGFCNTKILGYS